MSNSTSISLSVPFIYEAIVLKPRCRKPSLVIIKDVIKVQIKKRTLAQLPIAFKVKDSNIRWDGSNLWNFNLETSAKAEPRKVTLDEVLANTLDNGESYKYSCCGAAAPFKNFWNEFNYSNIRLGSKYKIAETGFNASLADENVVEKTDVPHREWVEDNRQAVLDRLNGICDSLLAVDNIMYRTASEPRYEVNSFGAGLNYSVAMFISYGYNPNISNKAYFNALEFNKAKASFVDRNPDKNKEAKTNCGNVIEVIIPEAVKCNPSLDHAA